MAHRQDDQDGSINRCDTGTVLADREDQKPRCSRCTSCNRRSLVQRVLDDPAWTGRLTDDDRRGLTPLF
jgi:hypothetical protein